MGKMFEALKKAEKERVKILKKAGNDPAAMTGTMPIRSRRLPRLLPAIVPTRAPNR